MAHSGAGTLRLLDALFVAGNLTNSAGTLNANSQNITVAGNWANTATFTPGTNTVTFNAGSGTQTINSGGASFNNLAHTGAGTAQLVTNSLVVTGNSVTPPGFLKRTT